MAPTSADAGIPETGALFDRHKERLRRTVRLRLDGRLLGLVDSSRRPQAGRRRGPAAAAMTWPDPAAPDPFLWLRQVTGAVLSQLHHERLGPDVRGDISLYRGALPEATSISLAAHLLGRGGGDDDKATQPALSRSSCFQEALNAIAEPLDREVLRPCSLPR